MVPLIITTGPPSPDASTEFAVDEKSSQEGGVSSMPGGVAVAAANPASSHHKEEVLVLTKDDFERGEPLGSGTFANVYQIKPRSLALLTHSMVVGCSSDEHSDSAETASTTPLQQHHHPQDPHSRHSSMSSSTLSTNDPFRSFCLKTLNSMALDDRYAIKAGLHCLAAEAKVLSELPGSHPHIIRLVGVSKDGFDVQHPARGFLVLERLSDTLEKKLKLWRFRKGGSSDQKPSLLQRLVLRKNNNSDDPAQRARVTEIGLGPRSSHGVFARARGVVPRFEAGECRV